MDDSDEALMALVARGDAPALLPSVPALSAVLKGR